MDKRKSCPQCRTWMKPLQQSCRCGYTEGSSKPIRKARNHYCVYPDCPAPGTSTESSSPSENSRWYCRWHYATRNDPVAASQVLCDLRNNGVPKPAREMDDLIQHRIDELGLRKGPGECSAHYVARCKASMPEGWIKSVLKRVAA